VAYAVRHAGALRRFREQLVIAHDRSDLGVLIDTWPGSVHVYDGSAGVNLGAAGSGANTGPVGDPTGPRFAAG
jgi:hypothetical protein